MHAKLALLVPRRRPSHHQANPIAPARRIHRTGRGAGEARTRRPPLSASMNGGALRLREQHLAEGRPWTRRVLPGEARGLLGVAGQSLRPNLSGLSTIKRQPTCSTTYASGFCITPAKNSVPSSSCTATGVRRMDLPALRNQCRTGDEARGASVSQFMISSGPRPTCASPWRVAPTRIKRRLWRRTLHCASFLTAFRSSRASLEVRKGGIAWCPFKRFKTYRNAGEPRQNPPQAEDALYVSVMLGDTVECRDCAWRSTPPFRWRVRTRIDLPWAPPRPVLLWQDLRTSCHRTGVAYGINADGVEAPRQWRRVIGTTPRLTAWGVINLRRRSLTRASHMPTRAGRRNKPQKIDRAVTTRTASLHS